VGRVVVVIKEEEMMNCDKCGRTLPKGVCECKRPFEDEYIMNCLSGLVENLKFPGGKNEAQLIDEYSCIITAYMRGRESGAK
jgi:hypothetical protein